LSNWLAEQATHEATVAQFLSKTFVPDLYLLNVGTFTLQPHEISRWLSTKLQGMMPVYASFLAETEQRTSMIIFNSPPVLAGIDASLVSSLVEQTFLLIATGQTTRLQANKPRSNYSMHMQN